MMERLLILVTGLVTGMLLASQPAQAAERKFSLSSFDQVRVIGGADIVITTGKGPSARAEADDRRLLDRISFRRSGSELIIAIRGRTDLARSSRTGNFSAEEQVTIYLTTFDVEKISHLGSGVVTLDKLEGRSPEVRVNGFGVLRIDQVDSDELTIGMAGGGELSIGGRSDKAMVKLLGTSSFDGAALSVETLNLTQRGPGRSQLMVEREANIINSGTGLIRIDGEPRCAVRSTGSAEIICNPDG